MASAALGYRDGQVAPSSFCFIEQDLIQRTKHSRRLAFSSNARSSLPSFAPKYRPIMFSSSLRKRKEWAAVIPSLNTSSSAWRESTLETCDITFPVTASNTTSVDFKVILSSLSELQSKQGKARVEKLFLVEGGEHVAVVLLLDGEDSILSFSNLQAEWLCWDYAMPMIPITTIKAVPGCLESLQRDCDSKQSPLDADTGMVNRDLVRWCVSGKPFSKDQVNILTGITSGFKDLADHSILPSGQAAIREYLGDEDGGRLISFLTNGSSGIQGQS